MQNYKFSAASESDIPAIKSINESCFSEGYPINVYQQLLVRTTVCREISTGLIVGYVIIADLATEDKDLIPFSHKNPVRDILVYTVLFSIAVLPAHRNKGIATHLLKLALCIVNPAKSPLIKQHSILLYSRKSNQSAKRIYTKFGFKLLKELPNYYSNPDENGLLLVYSK
jgi:ribosomal protein S18 acetylase RimI-like enzyme